MISIRRSGECHTMELISRSTTPLTSSNPPRLRSREEVEQRRDRTLDLCEPQWLGDQGHRTSTDESYPLAVVAGQDGHRDQSATQAPFQRVDHRARITAQPPVVDQNEIV